MISGVRRVAYNLALLDADGGATVDGPLSRRFDRELRLLRPKCTENYTMVGDLTVRAQELLGSAGIDESLYSVLRHVRRSIPQEMPKQACLDIFAAYVTIRKSG